MEQEIESKIENSKEGKQVNSSAKYFAVGIVVFLVVTGAGYFLTKANKGKSTAEVEGVATTIPTTRPAGPAGLKGQKFTDTQIYPSAVLISPGALSELATQVTVGWQVKSRSLSDGSTQIDLIPVGSEATEGDTSHSFNLKTGDQLYFIDLNPGDDNTGHDGNANDDIGIVVDSNGIVQ